MSKEKKSLQQEIEFRITHQNNVDDDDNDDDDEGSTLGIDEDYEDKEETEKSVETGEIQDVQQFMKDNVKIFEVDVKQRDIAQTKTEHDVTELKRRDVVITKFEHKTVNKRLIDVDLGTWNSIFVKNELSQNWESTLTSLILNPYLSKCNLRLKPVEFRLDHKRFYFHVTGECSFVGCGVKVSVESSQKLSMSLVINGSANHPSSPTPSIDEQENILSSEQENILSKIVEEYVCPDCGKTFGSVLERNVHHSETHGNFFCDKCQKSFQSEVRLNIHVKQCNFGKEFKCQYCLKTFANKRNLKDHINVLHSNEVDSDSSRHNFECQYCGKKFYKKFNLTSHLLRHSDSTPFTCNFPQCGKGFKREKTLLKHIQVIHEGIKEKYLCGQCGQQFSSQSGFKTHVALHAGIDYVKRNTKCNVCDKMFRCQSDLKTHLVVHSKEKPFSCTWPECNQSFSQKASLRDHLNVHEKKYECQNCYKSFGRERYLTMHLKICTKEKEDKIVPTKSNKHEDVQHIIVTKHSEMTDDEIEMTQVHIVQSEDGELMLVDQDQVEEEGVVHVVA